MKKRKKKVAIFYILLHVNEINTLIQQYNNFTLYNVDNYVNLLYVLFHFAFTDDNARVHLSFLENDPNSDYINASFIDVSDNDLPSDWLNTLKRPRGGGSMRHCHVFCIFYYYHVKFLNGVICVVTLWDTLLLTEKKKE